MTQPADKTYEAICLAHRLDVPEFYNIARDICDRHANAAPNKLAYFIERDDGLEYVTFGALRDRGNALANVFTGLGIERGDRVAIVLPLDSAVPTTHIACWKMGAISCPMSILFGPDALAYRFADADVRAVVTDRRRLEAVRSAIAVGGKPIVVLVVDGDGEPETIDFWPAVEAASASFETVETRAEDPAYINYTSGTTGQPKGALAAHRALLGHLPSMSYGQGYAGEGEIRYFPGDWSWLAGLASLMTTLHAGGVLAVRVQEGFDPADAFRFLAEHKVGIATLPPTVLRRMQAVPRAARSGYRLQLHTVLSGAEAVGADLYKWVNEELGAEICEAFGQTECNLCIMNNGRYLPARPGALGKVAPGFDVAIVDAAGNPLPTGAIGQIGIRAGHPVIMLEYWRNPEATKRKFANGWLLTGDLGRVDDDGFYWYVSRDDDIITSSGYRIGPGEIEEMLMKHPAVGQAAVVGIPDAVRTEIIKAFVVPAEGAEASEALAREIQDFVGTRLARHEVPREIAFIDQMPLTTTGKVMRRELKARELERRAAAGGIG